MSLSSIERKIKTALTIKHTIHRIACCVEERRSSRPSCYDEDEFIANAFIAAVVLFIFVVTVMIVGKLLGH